MNNLTRITAILTVFVAIIGCVAMIADDSDAASTIYVGGESASDNGDGSQTSPLSSISMAIGKAESGDTIQIMGDMTLTSHVLVNKNVNLDLGGHKIVFDSDANTIQYGFFVTSSCSISNGTIVNLDTKDQSNFSYTAIISGTGVKVTFGDLTVQGYGSDTRMNTIVQVQSGATLILDEGATVIEPADGKDGTNAVGVGVVGQNIDESRSALVVNAGATVQTSAYAISGNGSSDYADITINGGAITSNEAAAIYFPQIGDLTINSGDITGTTGVQYCGAGTLTIAGGKITATYEASDIPDKPADQGDGSFDDGAAVSIITRGEGYQDEDAGINTIEVNITGGEFVSQNNSAVKSYRAEFSDGSWVFGDSTSIEDSALDSFVVTGGDFNSATGRDAIVYDSTESTRTYSIAGGTFNTEVDKGLIKTGFDMSSDGTVTANLVATIDGKDYYSFTDAVEAAKESDAKGFTLLTDIDLSDVGDLDVSGLTIDFGGKKVTADWMTLFFVGENFTLKNGTFDNKGADYGLWIGDNVAVDGAIIENVTVDGGINIYNSQNVTLRDVTAVGKSYYAVWCDQGGNVTIEGGNYSSESSKTSALLGASSTGSSMVINGGTFTIGSGKTLALTGNFTDPVITGGTFNGLATDEDLSDYLADGYELGDNGTVVESEGADFVAEVNGSRYTSFEEAVAAAGIGSTVTLLKNATTGCIVISKSTDIDLGGYTLTISDTSSAKIGLDFCGGSVSSIYNGTIIDERAKGNDRNGLYTFDSYQEGTVVTINATIKTYEPNSTANSNYICSSESGATLILGPDAKFGYLEQDSYTNGTAGVIGVNLPGNTSNTDVPSTLEVNGAEIVTSGFAISTNGNMHNTMATVNSGTIHSTNAAAIYHPQYGTLTINGGTIVSDTNAGIVMRAGILEMNGGEIITYATGEVTAGDSDHLITPSAIVFDKSVNYPGVSQGFSATINDGTFKSADGVPSINVYTTESDADTVVSISGGSYSSDVSDYCADGFTVTENTDGSYGIVESVTVTFDMPEGIEDSTVTIAKDSAVPEVPEAPVGYTATFTSNGATWDPASVVNANITVTVTYELDTPTLTIDATVEGINATVTAFTTSMASVTYTYSAIGPDGKAVIMNGETFETQYPGMYTITVTATGQYGTATVEGTIEVTFEGQQTVEDVTIVDVELGSESATMSVGSIDIEIAGVTHGNVRVEVDAIDTVTLDGYGTSDLAYDISIDGSALSGDETFIVIIPVNVPEGQHIADGSAMVLYVPTEGVPEDMEATVGDDGVSVVFTTTHFSAYHVFYDLEADLPPFVPFPDDDDYVPIPPTIVQEDSGGDSGVKIAACAAAAVVAAILAILLATTYRRR